jgi:hypothetical protein
MAAQPMVLLVQDTTEMNLTGPQQQVEGAGPLDGGARRGVFVHAMEAFGVDGTPLGAVSVNIWTRDDPVQKRSVQEKARERAKLSIEQKESFRWLQGLRAAREVAQELPQTQVICIADSDADIQDLFAEPRGSRPVDWLIRASCNRCVQPQGENAEPKLRERLLAEPVLFTQSITVREREPKTSCETRPRRVARQRRTAEVQVRAASVTLRSPKRSLPDVAVNVVLALEPDPPAGEVAVEWILVTTLPIHTLEMVRQILQYYSVRWMIEVLFRTWKSGCRIQQRRF